VCLQQVGDHVQRAARRVGPFQGQAHQIHAQQAALGYGLLGKHGLVADGHAKLVGPHLAAPHPERLGQQHGKGLAHLRDLDVRAAHRRLAVLRARNVDRVLRFVGYAVAVLGQDHAAVDGGVVQGD
jgi:hypothetical protein